jgi:hypothetical protein
VSLFLTDSKEEVHFLIGIESIDDKFLWRDEDEIFVIAISRWEISTSG